MKKHYITPLTQIINVSIKSNLLTESALGSLTIDSSQEVESDLVKGTSSARYNVWNDDWSAE